MRPGSTVRPARSWTRVCLPIRGLTSAVPPTVTMYYDPIEDVHHTVPAAMGLTIAFYASAQAPDARNTSSSDSFAEHLPRAPSRFFFLSFPV